MKGNKHGFRRVLAVLLSAMLMVSNLGLTAFAEEQAATPTDFVEGQAESYDELITAEDEFAPEIEEPVEEADSQPDDGTWEENQDMEEGASDSSADGTDDGQQQDAVQTEDPMIDNGTQDDPLIVEEIPDKQPGEMDVPLDENPMEEPAVQQAEDESARDESVAFDQSRTVNGVVVTVKADPGVFPADAVLSVETVPVYQQQQADAAVDEVRGGNQNVAVSYTFDIKVIHPETGEEYQPAEGQTVSVSFALVEVADENLETQVYHVTEDETTGELAAESLDVNTEITAETGEATTAVVETDGFSIYTVEFTYNNLKYVLPGSTSVPMSEILTAVGLTGEVTAVEVSDASLFSASDETGEWIVTAHQPFSTTEWMKVTINNVVYEITVTDDGEITTWADLQAALSAGGSVTLTQDITASSSDSALTVPSGKTVTLDLNGYTIDRGLYNQTTNTPTANGYVIKNSGTLTIKDTSAAQTGKITGGNNSNEYSPYGGGIYNGGTLTLESGAISGNHAHDCSGVYNDFSNGVSFTMNGGAISGNVSDKGGAGVGNYGTFTMNGGTISGNSAVTRGGGVWSMGTFTMTDGAIENNTAGDNGGGVCVRWGYATISGGVITGNRAAGTSEPEESSDDDTRVGGCGGGLYMDQYCEVTLSGGTITGNTASNKGGDVYLHLNGSSEPVLKMQGSPVANVYLAEGKVITVSGAFTEGADIRVSTAAGAGVFTSGYGMNNGEVHPSQYFHASDASNGVMLSDGEAALAAGVVNNVSYVERSWDGTSVVSETKTTDAVAVPSNGNMTSGWYYLNSNVTKSDRVSLTGDTYLILGDNYTLNLKGLYIPQGSTLTIYAQSDGDSAGKLISKATSNGAGIGGKSGSDNGNIVIHGGDITAEGHDNCAGIGTNDSRTGGEIIIYGGEVNAYGGNNGAGIGGGKNCDGGTITIYGGTVNAEGGGDDSAAIGGGVNGNGGNITIYGGNITANGPTQTNCGENGAGIGGGNCGSGGTINIYGGTITTYSRDGAGIGGGDDGDGGNITINGGTIYSYSVNQGWGARIGGGCDAAPGTIAIHGGSITTVGGSGAGIGGGKRNKEGGTVTIDGGVINASGSYGIGEGEDGADVAITLGYTDATGDSISIFASSYNGSVTLNQDFNRYDGDGGSILSLTLDAGPVSNNNLLAKGYLKKKGADHDSVEYIKYSWSGTSLETTTETSNEYTLVTSALFTIYPDGLTSGDFVVTQDTTIEEYFYIRKGCTVNLIVSDGVTLTCKKGIGCGYDEDGQYATLNIFGTGKIVATGKENAAGIGGKDDETNGNITIHGTTIEATGGKNGAGIGGGDGGQDPDGITSIKIYAGTITATSGNNGAGIGGGNDQVGAHTYIYSGTITAKSTKYGAGIGGGNDAGTLGVFIYGGTITATGGEDGAGIGGGFGGGNVRKESDGGGINISGGVLDVTGGYGGAGIGGGFDASMSGTIVISGTAQGTIKGGKFAAGIGSGCGKTASETGNMKGTITISGTGGLLTVTGGDYDDSYNGGGAGIGSGAGGNMKGTFHMTGGNVKVISGLYSAGIGGGDVNGDTGGGGGDVYIGGGTLSVKVKYRFSGDNSMAIGKAEGSDHGGGSVYIHKNNNGTGKYMRVAYRKDGKEEWSTAKAGDRSAKCHGTDCEVYITECDHMDYYEVSSGIEYTFDDQTHTGTCKYCGYTVTDQHTLSANGICTICGYESESIYVFFDSVGGSNVEAQLVSNGEKATRPADPSWEGHTFQNWYRVTNAATGEHEANPFDFDTAITESITLIAVWNHEHDGITFESWNSDSSLPSSAGSYFLTKDVTLTNVWSWNGGTLNLCLAGHTVTGNIDNSSDALLTVNGGTLNLFDEEDGTVTLVNARAATVAVETGGTFNLHGGTITSETNDSSLQGVDVAGTFHMSGGRITGNPTGVRVKRGGAFTVSGSARVTGNTCNVDLTLGNGKIQIGGALSDDARIGVTAQAGVFTNGLNGGGDTPNGTAANFFSDSDDYLVALNAAGEAMLETAHTVTFEPGDESATGYMPVMRVGSAMTLPACDYSVEGKVFKEWSVKIGSAEPVSKQPEETIEITADTTVTAVWEDAAAAFAMQNLALGEQIGVRFWMDLSSLSESEKATGVMTFTVHGSSGKQTVTYAQAETDSYNGVTYPVFRCRLSSVQMNDEITAVFSYEKAGNTVSISKTYTVKEYIQAFDTVAASYPDAMVKLVHALADYGHYSQPFLSSYWNWTVGVDHADMDLSYSTPDQAAAKTGTESLKAKKTENEDVEIKYALLLDTKTSICVYFIPKNGYSGSVTAQVNGKNAAVKQLTSGSYNGWYQVTIEGLGPKELGDMYTVTATTDSGNAKIELSAMSYVYTVLDGNYYAEQHGPEAMAALYFYYDAAKAFN